MGDTAGKCDASAKMHIYKVKCVSGRVENEFSERYTERAHNEEGEIAPYFMCFQF